MFCKFLVCHGFDLFLCQAMALLVLPEKKSIRKKTNIWGSYFLFSSFSGGWCFNGEGALRWDYGEKTRISNIFYKYTFLHQNLP